jgi:hypothetical protein
MADFALPDMVVREEQMAAYLPALAEEAGCAAVPEVPEGPAAGEAAPFALEEIYDDEIEARARAAYPRDYLMFGFGDWAPAG